MCSAQHRALNRALEPPLGQTPPWQKKNRRLHLPKKRRRVDGAELSLMEQRTAALTRLTECMEAPPPAPDDSAAFGMVVAEYLRSMSLAARARCQISVLSAIAAHLD
ncbi:hypothetical protein HPB47_008631 [Ixodes persulcatus]|uniref:Uncharacterized protein n=1 Tax=Ixodes persulcatus TaxID=34615 RepID=A0AC60P471_IXOPE|nr:hypothetical protein HPB47_008631 [Ixodes persulcatus]